MVVTVETKVAEIIFKTFCSFIFLTATLTIYSKITISNVIIMQKILSFNHIVLGM